jgi:hypothetical protein
VAQPLTAEPQKKAPKKTSGRKQRGLCFRQAHVASGVTGGSAGPHPWPDPYYSKRVVAQGQLFISRNLLILTESSARVQLGMAVRSETARNSLKGNTHRQKNAMPSAPIFPSPRSPTPACSSSPRCTQPPHTRPAAAPAAARSCTGPPASSASGRSLPCSAPPRTPSSPAPW